MPYHFPGQDRRQGDRRRGPDPSYAGPERRRGGDRRKPRREPMSNTTWFIMAAAVLMAVDQVTWQGAGTHAILMTVNGDLAGLRDWGADVWTYRG